MGGLEGGGGEGFWGGGVGGGDDDDIGTQTPRTISPQEPFYCIYSTFVMEDPLI